MTVFDVEVRKPPVDAQFALHLPRVRGKCRWCGESCAGEKTRFGGDRIHWHATCRQEFVIIAFPDGARDAVFARDKGICCDCGGDFSQEYIFRPEFKARIEDGVSIWNGGDHATYNPIIWVSLWHVDHKVPLWKVRHLPPIQRLAYFKLANMVTRCRRCHDRKTVKETGERKHFDHLSDKAPKPKSRWPKRTFPKRLKRKT